MIVDELIAVLGYDLKGEDKLRRFNSNLDGVASKLSRFAEVAALAAAAAGVAIAAGAVALGKSVISTTAQFESYAATLETVEGSAAGARKALDWVTDFAQKTPFEVSELTEAFVKLRAYGLDPTSGLMDDLGNAASAMGKTLDQAVEMIADASTGEFERLKEFGIKAQQKGDQVTFSWSENGKTLSKTVKKSGDEITKFIRERFAARFDGAMIRQSKTWNGMMSNMSDAWTNFQRKIGEAGFFETAKAQLSGLMDFINRQNSNGNLDRWARSISTVFSAVASGVGAFVTQVAKDIGTYLDLISSLGNKLGITKEIVSYFAAAMLGIAIAAAPVWAALVAVGLAIDDFLTYMRGGKSVIGDMITWLGQMKEALVAWVTSLPGAISDGIANAFQAGFDRARQVVLDFVAWATAQLQSLNPFAAWGSRNGSDGKGVPPNTNQPPPASGVPTANTGRVGMYDGLKNLNDNIAKTGDSNAAKTVTNTVNDARNQSVTVNVGGVNVQQPSQAPAAVGAAVGAAAAGAAQNTLPPARIGGGGGF